MVDFKAIYSTYIRVPYEAHLKTPLEAISLVAACVFFIVYLFESDDRSDAARLQRLQIAELCSSLASKVEGTDVIGYQEPRTFDEFDASNDNLDDRIEWLNGQCKSEQAYIPPSRERRPASAQDTR